MASQHTVLRILTPGIRLSRFLQALLLVAPIATFACGGGLGDEPAPITAPRATARPDLTPVFPVDPASVATPGAELHPRQELRVPDGHGGVAPWRDEGGQRIFSTWVYGTVYQIDTAGAIRPYIGTGHTVDETGHVWTIKLREDAVFQDGTPITAADIKAYWEHGALPLNNVAWGGASQSLGVIEGWENLRNGYVTEAEGLVALDDHTLQVTTVVPFPTWPLSMASWHAGISKLEQVLTDAEWFTRPIAAGPYRLTTDRDTRKFGAVAWDEAGIAFWGRAPNIRKLTGLGIDDAESRVIMFENGEIDLMTVDDTTYEAALDPGHPFNSLLKVTPAGGLRFIKMKAEKAPLEDLLVRRSLAHGADMPSTVNAVWGPGEAFATGLISPFVPCHDADATGHVYDPELARQELAASSYARPSSLPALVFNVSGRQVINMATAVKEYWKDNLSVELDLLKGRTRESSQLSRFSVSSWIPDPIQIVSDLTRVGSIGLSDVPGGYPGLDALVERARSLPLDDPERCAAFQAVEAEYMDKAYMMPIRWIGGRRWVVQPWVIGFESSSNGDINTQPWMYILRH